jgi:phosphate transport system ATP-binding protein
MMEVSPPLSPPPPVRRIVLADPPTVVAAPPPSQRPQRSPGPAAPARIRPPATAVRERMRVEDLSVAYAGKLAVRNVSLAIREGEVLALIGPSGCGKTTLLRTLNRLTELTPTAVRTGTLRLDDDDVDRLDVTNLRRRVTMVFQQPNPFPMSIFDNVAYALREQARRRPKRADLADAVEQALRRAGLWDEVADDLDRPALRLSGGQQQRLCIARALAAKPEVLLLDEPCSALDPRSTETIERLIVELRSNLAVVIVTHNLQQAYRVADGVAFMFLGELVEHGSAEQVFGAPRAARTREYLAGTFG